MSKVRRPGVEATPARMIIVMLFYASMQQTLTGQQSVKSEDFFASSLLASSLQVPYVATYSLLKLLVWLCSGVQQT